MITLFERFKVLCGAKSCINNSWHGDIIILSRVIYALSHHHIITWCMPTTHGTQSRELSTGVFCQKYC